MKPKVYEMILEVTIDEPEGVTEELVHEHVVDAVECWGGQLHPDHPFSDLHGQVKVRRYVRRK